MEWRPTECLSGKSSAQPYAVLLLNQPITDPSTLERLWDECKKPAPILKLPLTGEHQLPFNYAPTVEQIDSMIISEPFITIVGMKTM